MIWRVAWEEGTAADQHAEDWLTESAAKVRERTLREAGYSRVVYFAVAGDRAAACWCGGHGPGVERLEESA